MLGTLLVLCGLTRTPPDLPGRFDLSHAPGSGANQKKRKPDPAGWSGDLTPPPVAVDQDAPMPLLAFPSQRDPHEL